MCHLRYRLRVFLFRRKVPFRSQDIEVFVFLNIPWFTKSRCHMSISAWDWVHFWIYLLNNKSLSHETWPIDRYKFQVLFSLATCPNYSITNNVRIKVFHFFNFFFEKGEWRTIKNGKYQLLKMARYGYVVILIKS